MWTWGTDFKTPAGTNLDIAFGGYADIALALNDAAATSTHLLSKKLLNVGGGNWAGHWTVALIQKLITYINNGSLSSYQGICFDIEEGDAGLSASFAQVFAAAKAKGLFVFVTISFSEPYGIPDGHSLMLSFFSSSNIDVISPQMYSCSSGTSCIIVTTQGGSTPWTLFQTSLAAVVPSIPTGANYAQLQSFFASKGVTTRGYVQWLQV